MQKNYLNIQATQRIEKASVKNNEMVAIRSRVKEGMAARQWPSPEQLSPVYGTKCSTYENTPFLSQQPSIEQELFDINDVPFVMQSDGKD